MQLTLTDFALYLTRQSAQAEEELFEMFEYNTATNRVNYLQSISLGKQFQLPQIQFFPTLLVLTIDFWKTNWD